MDGRKFILCCVAEALHEDEEGELIDEEQDEENDAPESRAKKGRHEDMEPSR